MNSAYTHGVTLPLLTALALSAPLLAASQPPASVAPAAPAATRADDAAAAANGGERNGFAPTLKAAPRRVARGTAAVEARPYTPIRSTDDEGQIPEIEMFVGESRVFPTPGVARIAVGNGAAVTADALDGKEVILFANAVGTSSLFIWNADGRYQRLKINIVPGDTTRYAREIAAFLSTIPRTKASVVGANIVVEGDDLSDSDLAKIDELAKRYPQIVNFTNRVGWEQMIQMDVKVVEFPVTALTQIGLNWSPAGGAAVGAIWSPGRRGDAGPYEINIPTGSQGTLPITSPNSTSVFVPSRLNILSAINLGLDAQLNLLAQQGKASLLAEPQLSARSGSKASFLAGGEIPYAVSTRDGTYVQFKSYGVKLEITPRMGQHGTIRAAIQTEVSGIDSSVTTAGGPALLSRRTETEFNVRAGETIVLSGLLQREVHDDITKVPFLGDIPILGALFRSKSYQNKETELVVFITPTLVDAHSDGVTDRIRRTDERLEQQMGPTPYLSAPTQPGVDYQRPDALPPAPAASGVVPVPIAIARPPVATPVVLPQGSPTAFARSDDGSLLTVTHDAALHVAPGINTLVLRALPRGATLVMGNAETPPEAVGRWRSVVLGDLAGWVRADAVAPLRGSADNAAAASGDAPGVRTHATNVSPVATGSGRRDITPSSGEPAAPPQRYRVQLAGLALRLTPDINAGIVARCRHGDQVVALAQTTQAGWTAVEYGSGSDAKRGWVATEWLIPIANP